MNYNIITKFKNQFKLTVMDVSVSGFLIAMVIIVAVLTNFTGFRVLKINFEYMFYIIFGFFLGAFKGLMLSIITDTLFLLIGGNIGLWAWEFAVIGPGVTAFASLFFIMVRKYKIFSYWAPNIIIVLSFAVAFGTVIWHGQTSDISKGFTLSRTFGINKLSEGVIYGLLSIFGIILLVVAFLWYLYFKTKNKHYLLVITTFSLIVLIIVVFRWAWHPFAYVRYLNRINATSIKGSSFGTLYFVWMIRNVLKSLITIPLYTALLVPLIQPFELLRKRHLLLPLTYTY